ncbi:peptidoglycan-binding domain-containing protein [Streptomyces griseorubiginosus]|uniref:peptidoglycan-binding domain-containing protein n=1 Tax=Streptomyces griseorubiginosus TaxID=67304 RepID=UPI002E81F0E4|nr:peptidoglycan-binding domain-containing protein [Streptomyces griseorubiginosus]WUB47447.1 peptidoglycan-binding protein [Streptomyces griseorubiginosus]WUB55972.1 peptidoglycan-binding protein [Streptomyces griseorubiginosus]
MAESNSHLCPECGAPRGADNTPSCGCTRRAADALRETRTAEAAAAEDFDPLRIRPYVDLDDETTPVPQVPATEETMPLRPVPPVPAPHGTRALPADLSLFQATDPPAAPDAPTPDTPAADHPRRSRRPTVLLAAAGAVVAVVAAAGFASGLFAYESPSRDAAAPQDVRPAVPDATTTPASASPSRTTESVRPPAAPPSPTASTSASASPSPSVSSASPSPSRSTAPAATPTASAATDSAAESDAAREAAPPVLRRGSEGPEVVELELRLTQLGLYTRKASGHYNEGVEDAVSRYQWARGVQPTEYGVYDLVTRQRLESETTEP